MPNKKKLFNRLQQLFADNQPRPQHGLQVKNEDNSATLYLYDAIGGWYGITAEEFAGTLNDITADTIHLRINSPGGDVFDARAMQVAMKQHPANIVAHIDGLAASAATYLALGANEVEMADGAFFMIHNAWTLGIGNANDFEELAGMLRKVDGSIVKDYAKKTGAENKQITTWMDNETWFTADEALEHGFIDRIYDDESTSNQNHWNLSAYQNTPANLLNTPEPPPEDDATQQARQHKANLLRRVNMLDAIAS